MIELVVALSILAVAAAVAIPALSPTLAPSRADVTQITLANAELAARRRGADVILVATSKGHTLIDPASGDTLSSFAWPVAGAGHTPGLWRVTALGRAVPLDEHGYATVQPSQSPSAEPAR